MLATQSTAEDLQKMKDGLDKDGYSESVLLPAGWMIKFKKHKSNFILLSPQFETFRSVKTLDDLNHALAELGYQISRSALYHRLLPKGVSSTEAKKHVRTVPVRFVSCCRNA